VDAVGPRSTYVVTGAATAAAGLLILLLAAAVLPRIAVTDE
jgi:hypothetical protein